MSTENYTDFILFLEKCVFFSSIYRKIQPAAWESGGHTVLIKLFSDFESDDYVFILPIVVVFARSAVADIQIVL